MHITYTSCPDPAVFDAHVLPERPAFIEHTPNFALIDEHSAKYADVKNILIIGHGGSVTSFEALYGSLKALATKEAYIVSTIDPDYIYSLKQKLRAHDTLVIAISKSGETTTQIEALIQFIEYPLLFITSPDSPLSAIAKKINAPVVPHPVIGGRYTGMTEVALLPAALCGLDVRTIYSGAQSMYKQWAEENGAWRAASIFSELEQQGYVDVFIPVYSESLFAFNNLITQLCHESFGKNGVGQTYVVHEAPESQHHTNQRFLGGRKNMAGFVMSVEHPQHPLSTHVPTSLHSVVFKDQPLVALHKITLQHALSYEREGVLSDAHLKNIPMADMIIADISPEHVGELLAFWQLYAVYGSIVRHVNPFDQPEVENSKRISFDKRLQHRGIL